MIDTTEPKKIEPTNSIFERIKFDGDEDQIIDEMEARRDKYDEGVVFSKRGIIDYIE